MVVYVTENLGWATTNDLRLELSRYCLGLDMSFHTAHTPGEMIERIDGDVMALSNFFSQFILQVVGNAFLVLGVLIALIWTDWRVSLVLSIFVRPRWRSCCGWRISQCPYWEKERQSSADCIASWRSGFQVRRTSARIMPCSMCWTLLPPDGAT
jgi:ABC-type multidrug transport system fused ATPase/permease subunit